MLGNCEKFAPISSTTNEWPQNDQSLIMASKNNMVMEKPTQEQIQQQHGLKCPRCDSSNTKFCYYNNYSLSQPRHFCKACKRYWTRGGTLRNVPVGGGCRKNKRVKRPAATAAIDPMPSTSSAPVASANPNGQSQIDHINPLFYGLQSSISFPRFNNSRVDMAPVYDQYDLQPQMNALGFSSAGLMASDVTSKSVLSSYPVSFFGSLTSSVSASTSTTMASLIANNLNQPKFKSGGGLGDARGANSSLGFNPINEDMQMQGMKIGECQSGLNRIEQMGGSSDPNNLIWNATGVGDWLDPANNFVIHAMANNFGKRWDRSDHVRCK